MKVVPAVCVGLFGFLALRLGSVIRSTGPAAKLSPASSTPPGLPSSLRAALTLSVASAKGARSGKMRPNVVGAVVDFAACARGGRTSEVTPPPAIAAAPAPAPARQRN